MKFSLSGPDSLVRFLLSADVAVGRGRKEGRTDLALEVV